MAGKQRFRLRFVFWLDMLDSEEQALADYVETLKGQRSFAQTIRDGLRLVRDLRAGRVDVLFELFPWVRAEFLAGVVGKGNSDPSGSDKLQRELEQIKDLLLRSSTPPVVAAGLQSPRQLTAVSTGTPRALEVPKFDLPRFDDDDDTDTLVLAKDTSTDSALNFLNSMLALQQ